MCGSFFDSKYLKSHIKKASELESLPHRLLSGVTSLDQWLEGGLQRGSLSEWGMPHGQEARRILLRFLAENDLFTLWVYGHEQSQVYPPAWVSLGVNLEKTFFVHCDQPIKKLRPVFTDNAFPLVVIDSPKKLSKGELAFVSHQLRKNQQTLLLVRNFYLSRKKGNPLSSLRINVSWQPCSQSHQLHCLKGGPQTHLNLSLNDSFEKKWTKL